MSHSDFHPIPTCILMPTHEKYLWCTELSQKWLDRFWPGHPEVFVCGVEPKKIHHLPLRVDPLDWMEVIYDATRELMARGYQRCFLILDDQGPIAPCHAEHLNRTIPEWMSQFNASMISLRGWDHRNAAGGRILGDEFYRLQHQSADFKWKFALHPALWRLDILNGLLEILLRDTRPQMRTPWKFETRIGKPNPDVPLEWEASTYRICGRRMMLHPLSPWKLFWRGAIDGLCRNIKSWAVIYCGKKFNRFLNYALHIVSVYYEGPYPWHFNGIMLRGQLNPYLIRFLQRHQQFELIEEIQQAYKTSRSGG